MHPLTQSPLAELRRIAEEFETLREHLIAQRIDFSALVGAERDLTNLTQCALARLATDAEKALAFEQLLESVEQCKRQSSRQRVQLLLCRSHLKVLCAGHASLEVEALRTLSLAAELGRTVWALGLVDRALRVKGQAFVGRMLERVKSNVVGGSVGVGTVDPTSNRIVQLASRLALERISSNSSCPPALRTTASVLIERVGFNLERIGVSDKPALLD